ncbi:hypothetical protein SK128_015309 [Halocaridina rubra]|uniref:Methyltransferase FkbM domain-containing protein n=1 Tax=Halocaridina rubra TaxID=373956 RepID=A0AAN8XCU7_HALRR
MLTKKRFLQAVITVISASSILVLFTYLKVPTCDKTSELRYRVLGPLASTDIRLINHVRLNYLHPPSPLPYTLTNGVELMYTKFSKGGTWGYIQFHLEALFQHQKAGFFVEAGALDGEFFSNTLWLESSLGWSGLLVEPDRQSFRDLQKKHRRAWISNTCLSDQSYPKESVFISLHGRKSKTEILITGMLRGGGHEVGVTLPPEYEDKLHADKLYTPVQCFPLTTYLLALNVTTVDFLSLDVQGSERDILKTVLWDLVKIRVMAVEIVDGTLDKDFIHYMAGKEYVLTNEKYAANITDYIFVRRDEKDLVKTARGIHYGAGSLIQLSV